MKNNIIQVITHRSTPYSSKMHQPFLPKSFRRDAILESSTFDQGLTRLSDTLGQ